MRSPLRSLPDSWKCDATVVRGGGRDRFNNPLPVSRITREGVLVGPRASVEPLDFSELSSTSAVLYDEAEDGFTYQSTDQIEIPAGARMAGTWAVQGRPGEWPFGTEVALERA